MQQKDILIRFTKNHANSQIIKKKEIYRGPWTPMAWRNKAFFLKIQWSVFEPRCQGTYSRLLFSKFSQIFISLVPNSAEYNRQLLFGYFKNGNKYALRRPQCFKIIFSLTFISNFFTQLFIRGLHRSVKEIIICWHYDFHSRI